MSLPEVSSPRAPQTPPRIPRSPWPLAHPSRSWLPQSPLGGHGSRSNSSPSRLPVDGVAVDQRAQIPRRKKGRPLGKAEQKRGTTTTLSKANKTAKKALKKSQRQQQAKGHSGGKVKLRRRAALSKLQLAQVGPVPMNAFKVSDVAGDLVFARGPFPPHAQPPLDKTNVASITDNLSTPVEPAAMLQAINHIPLGPVPVARASADDDLFAKIVADIDFIFEKCSGGQCCNSVTGGDQFPRVSRCVLGSDALQLGYNKLSI